MRGRRIDGRAFARIDIPVSYLFFALLRFVDPNSFELSAGSVVLRPERARSCRCISAEGARRNVHFSYLYARPTEADWSPLRQIERTASVSVPAQLTAFVLACRPFNSR